MTTAEEEHPLRKLTDTQLGWIKAMEAENESLPLGYARAMVEMYVDNPEFFEPENIDRLAATAPPKLERTDGSVETLTGADAEAVFEKMKRDVQQLEVIPLTEEQNNKSIQ
jgi:hypothetical protein